MSSILNDIKAALDIEADYTEFDTVITMHINSVFSTLNQIGVGPDDGFAISGNSEEWVTFLGEDVGVLKLSNVKTYVYLRVRLLFDPPSTGYLVDSFKQQIQELEWRLEVATSPANDIQIVDDEVIELILEAGRP